MTPRRANARKYMELEVPQVPNSPLAKKVTYVEFLAVLQVLSQATTAQDNI